MSLATLTRTQPLRVERSFVVQFRGTTALSPEEFSGRIEHIASGRVEFFSSPDELYRCFAALPASQP